MTPDDGKKQCNSCGKSVGKNQTSVKCRCCNHSYHLLTACLNLKYDDLPNVRKLSACFKCLTDSMPFNLINNEELNTTLQNTNQLTRPNLERSEQLIFNPFELNEAHTFSASNDDNLDPDLNFHKQADRYNICKYM